MKILRLSENVSERAQEFISRSYPWLTYIIVTSMVRFRRRLLDWSSRLCRNERLTPNHQNCIGEIWIYASNPFYLIWQHALSLHHRLGEPVTISSSEPNTVEPPPASPYTTTTTTTNVVVSYPPTTTGYNHNNGSATKSGISTASGFFDTPPIVNSSMGPVLEPPSHTNPVPTLILQNTEGTGGA